MRCSGLEPLVTIADFKLIEKVQIRAVKQISGLKGVSYEERLLELGLESLESRRTRFDLIQTYKIINKIDNVDYNSWFTLVGHNLTQITRLTSYPSNIMAQRSRTDLRTYFFSNRVTNTWDTIPTEIKQQD